MSQSHENDARRQNFPPLEVGSHEWVEVLGKFARIGSQTLLMLPFAASIGRSRGRRYRVIIGRERPTTRILLNVGGQAALIMPADLEDRNECREVRIKAVHQKVERPLPGDFAVELARHGADIDALPPHERQQMLLMIAESTSKEVRALRIQAAVAAVAAKTFEAQP